MAWRNADSVRVWFKTSDIISRAQHLRWFKTYVGKPDDFMFLIQDHQSGSLAGQIALYSVDRKRGEAEMGRLIAAPEFRGKGLMRKACARLIDYSFNVLGLKRLYLEVLISNAPAIRLYERLGFHIAGQDGNLLKMSLSAKPAN